jgi:hypothetical protein
MNVNVATSPAKMAEKPLSDLEKMLRAEQAKRMEELRAKIKSACADSALPIVHSGSGAY